MAAPRVPIDALPEQTAVVGSDLLVVQNGATTKKMAITTLGNGVGVPTGGTVGQVLTKSADTDFSTTWADQTGGSGGGGGGLTTDQVVDVIAAALIPGNNIDVAFNNSANTLTIDVEPLTTADISGLPALLSGKVDKTQSISTTTPLTGGGTLGGNLTLGINTFTTTLNGAVPAPGAVDTTKFLRTDGTWQAPAGGGSGGGISTEDAVDAVALATRNGPGINVVYDDALDTLTYNVVNVPTTSITDNAVTNPKLADMPAFTLKGNTAASTTDPQDLTVAQARSLLQVNNVDNTADASKPVSTAQATALAAKVDKTQLISTTAPLFGGGDLQGNRILDITDFNGPNTRGSVPSPGPTSTGRFLKDDGTWTLPPSSASGVGGSVFPFTYNTSTLESISGSQLRGNNATFANSTKLWISEVTVDGLDVTVGLGRIKTGFQVYVQDYTSASRYAIFGVTSDAIDKGTYWEVNVTPVSSAGVIPGGKVALQSLTTAQSNTLFSTTTTAAGLAPGSNGATSLFLRGDATWQAIPSDTTKVTNVQGVTGIWTGTQAAYDAIVTKVSTVLYVIA